MLRLAIDPMGTRNAYLRYETIAVLSVVALGCLCVLPLHTPPFLVRCSYDLLQLAMPAQKAPPPIVIYMDEQATQDYQQKPGQPWSRAVHARLLDRLTLDKPSVVVFDAIFSEAGDPQSDALLARAMRRNGRVVLAGDRVSTAGQNGYTLFPPLDPFETNAAGWGTAKVYVDSDRVVRRYDPGDDQHPSLAWKAATISGGKGTALPHRRLSEDRWLNYYGSASPFASHSMSYSNAETRAPGFFAGKAVFIGGKPQTLLRGEVADVFGTPFTLWKGSFVPGVDITAIAYANLMADDSLHRTGWLSELGVLILVGVGAGAVFPRLGRTQLVCVAIGCGALGAVIAAGICLSWGVWFPWVVVCGVQIPSALVLSLVFRWPRQNSTAAALKASPPLDAEASHTSGRVLEIPDHTLIRCIGEGAYGQVWIARNAIGLHHAVKVVYQNRFGGVEPYQRAFRGIQKFMPISRSHKGFVNILHVGRNESVGYFFCIMELGDDQKTGQDIDPSCYLPRTLSSDLRQRGTLPPRECLGFMLALTETVHELHLQRLVHRDIKPANILFVRGNPKLADIDLVTDISRMGETSRIGTEGYMAPEGPGAAQADVYSLGRVLYVALTGKSPDQCPELPTQIGSVEDPGLFMEMNQILCKACDANLTRRYPSAALMRADLLKAFHKLQ